MRFKLGLVLTIVISVASIATAKPTSSADDVKPGKQATKGGITAYDQRQTGKFNIHLNIKDVQLISLKGDRFSAGAGVSHLYLGCLGSLFP